MLSVVPGALWVLFLLVKASQGWWADRKVAKAKTLKSFVLPLLVTLKVTSWELGAAIGLLVLAFVSKATCDILTHQQGNSIFEKRGAWFAARVSWLNKYKLGSWEVGAPVPRFLGSTTVFAWTTNFWHAADSLYLTSYLIGAMLLGAYLRPVQAWPWVLAVTVVKGAGGACFRCAIGCFKLDKKPHSKQMRFPTI